jgi:hypothetical protein
MSTPITSSNLGYLRLITISAELQLLAGIFQWRILIFFTSLVDLFPSISVGTMACQPRVRCSTVPLSWSIVRGTSSLSGYVKPGRSVWRCGLIQRVPGMTERRCTVAVRKSDISSHVEKGPHIFDLASENDQGFPPTRRRPASQFDTQQFAAQIDTATTLVAG